MKHISPIEFNQALQDAANNATIMCIDVRSQDEYRAEHIPGVVNMPLQNLASNTDALVHAQSIYVHCLSGGRSAMAGALLEKMFPKAQVYNLVGGISAWKQAKLETVK